MESNALDAEDKALYVHEERCICFLRVRSL
jgi:hypothetical protein